jgi:hypothetical protein
MRFSIGTPKKVLFPASGDAAQRAPLAFVVRCQELSSRKST